MFRKNYHFEVIQDCGRILHFYKMGITRKEAKVHAKYLIGEYNCKYIQYYTMGTIMSVERGKK